MSQQKVIENIFKKVELNLPRYIAEWIEMFSREIAMDPEQLITHVFHYYYEVWVKSRRKTIEEVREKIRELKNKARTEEAKKILEELEREISKM